jgi:hypothetical protein
VCVCVQQREKWIYIHSRTTSAILHYSQYEHIHIHTCVLEARCDLYEFASTHMRKGGLTRFAVPWVCEKVCVCVCVCVWGQVSVCVCKEIHIFIRPCPIVSSSLNKHTRTTHIHTYTHTYIPICENVVDKNKSVVCRSSLKVSLRLRMGHSSAKPSRRVTARERLYMPE